MENQRKKLFLISNMWPDSQSPGYGSFVKNVIDGMKPYGIDTTYSALIVGRPKGKLNKLRSYLQFYARIFTGFWKNYDYIYLHFPNQAIPLLNILYKFKHPKIVINYHGEDLLYKPSGYTGWLGRMTERFCTRYVDKIIVPSEYFKKIVADREIVPVDKVVVSPSGGISETIFYPKETIVHRNSTDKSQLGYIGRLEQDKGINTFLEVLTRLAESTVPFEATIIGYGSEYENVINFIKNEKLGDTVKIIPGLPQSDLGPYYRKLDLFIFPSKSESLGLTGIEAMACGIPVVGSNVGGIATYIKEGVNGYLVEPGNAEGFYNAVITFISSNKEKRETLSHNAFKTAQEYYVSKVIKRLVKVFLS